MSEDQQSTRCKTYQNQLMPDSGKKFYLDEKSADVHFSFDSGDGNVTRVAAHKILLAVGSDVFDAMFYGDLKEAGDVKVADVSDAAFKEFLQYFYLSEVKLTEENIAGVIHLGHKYNVKKCVKNCIKFLIDTLNDENFYIGLHIGILYNHQALVIACEKFVIENTAGVFKSIGFLDCDKAVLEHILKLNILSCSEVEVFEACMAWVKAKSGQSSVSKELVDTHLGRLFYEIRFKSMTIQEFCALTPKYDSVLRSDCFTLMNTIVTPEFQPENFNNRPRQAIWNDGRIIKCARALNDSQLAFMQRTTCTTIFSTNKPLLLGDLTCSKIGVVHKLPVRDLRSDLLVDVEIIEDILLNGANPKTLLKMKAKLRSEDTNVLLSHPILVRPGFFYTICLGPFPDDHCYYSTELKKLVRPKSDISIKFHKNVTSSTQKVIGFISVLKFNRI